MYFTSRVFTSSYLPCLGQAIVTRATSNWRRVILIALPHLVLSLFIFFYIFDIRVKQLLLASSSNPTHQNTSDRNQINILIGILTPVPDNYDRHRFLRLVYGTQSSSIAKTDVKFVFLQPDEA
ncbi:hypothetical protein OIU78_025633 [Salix suchowensis]|nr:hypothetical protein OIU78_025633 [Salix suchowensis]